MSVRQIVGRTAVASTATVYTNAYSIDMQTNGFSFAAKASGTTPDVACSYELSADGGTNWAASVAITGFGNLGATYLLGALSSVPVSNKIRFKFVGQGSNGANVVVAWTFSYSVE